MPVGEYRSEQSVDKILAALDEVIMALDEAGKAKVEAIGVTGQMHGVVLWNTQETAPLITWKDRRASELQLLNDINRIPGAENLKDGFGITSLACLAREDELNNWRMAATIHDYLVYRICGLEKPVTDPGDAASWGCYDILGQNWRMDTIKSLGIPPEILPEVVDAGTGAGELLDTVAAAWKLPAGIPVVAGTGG